MSMQKTTMDQHRYTRSQDSVSFRMENRKKKIKILLFPMIEYVLYISMYFALNILGPSLRGVLFSNDMGNTDRQSVIGCFE